MSYDLSCLKCGIKIIRGGRLLPNWRQVGYLNSDNNIVFIATCRDCLLEGDDLRKAGILLSLPSQLLKAAEKNNKLVEDTFVDIQKEKQGNKCLCGKEFEEEFIVDGNYVRCGKCYV